MSLQHNELRDLTANYLSEICYDVTVELQLNELTGETLKLRSANSSADARIDIAARGVWSK